MVSACRSVRVACEKKSMELLRTTTGRMLVEAHRGCQALAPENSWPALEIGRHMGADLLEVDVQLSHDGTAFLRHNYTLPDGRWCHAVPWAELQTLTVQGHPFPVLEDVLIWARGVDALLSLDLKSGFAPEGRVHAEVVRLLKRTQTCNRVMLLAWDHVELRHTKSAYPEVTTRALVRARPADLRGMLCAVGADAVSLSYDVVRPQDVEQAHAVGIAVALVEMWRPDFDLAQRLGVDIVSWGNPQEAKQRLGYAVSS